ncbi:MAG: sigma-70 family RNA polymerase sigma factor [Candidatus Dadabacteria bacterium]|nr:sigma-70 family RNA polymerase sigma factor [Candidatus Dadabacteria bacterium]
MGRLADNNVSGDLSSGYGNIRSISSYAYPKEEIQGDEQLIREYVNNGNEQAFGMLVKKYENIVFGLAYRILGNHSLSEEVMQEVFLILTRKLSTFREESKFSTWLYRVVVNVCYLYKKMENKHSSNLRLDQDINDDPGSHFIDYLEDNNSLGPYEESKNSEIVELVEKELKNIPEKYRVVFILRDVDGLTNPEVARILGITLAAVKSRILRARKFLKSRLQHKLVYES